jgi:hypothetical protein
MKSKKAAMELSVGTIVIIVLAMSMLIFGLILIRNIFITGENALRLTDEQLMNELASMYGAELRLGVYPSSGKAEVTQGELGGFGVGIKNLRSGSSANVKFSYKVEISDLRAEEKCQISKEELMSLISIGEAENDLSIASGETYVTRVVFDTQQGDPLCTIRFRVSALANNEPYGTPQSMDVTFRAKR